MAANPRAKAQRATAKAVRVQRAAKAAHRPIPHILPTAITAPSRQAMVDYGNRVLNGREPMPESGTREAKQLARLASLSRWGKVDPAFKPAFQQYWYHDEQPHDEPEDEDEEYYYDEDDEDEE